MFDVLVVGGGPAGSVCASALAKRGVHVALFEKETFPRFRLGESLLPHSLPILERIGVLPAVAARFIPKYGARFHDDVLGRKDRFSFDGAWQPAFAHAFQVPRATYDALLLAHAASLGTVVEHGVEVLEVTRGGDGRASGVILRGRDGGRRRVEARFVVDASGRDALGAHAARSTSRIDGLDQTALFAHFEGVSRPEGRLAGDIDIALFRRTPADRPNWFWFIPFADGTTSVGAVVSRAWLRGRASGGTDAATRLFEAAVTECPTASRLLDGARRLWPEARAAADFSYRVGAIRGAGTVAVGDAGGFIDPLFSTGVHLAQFGAATAADAIAEHLATGAEEVFEAWERTLRAGAETFILAVQAFYGGSLLDYFFAKNQHTALRRSITSLLAGDVFHDKIWLRDARKRLGEFNNPGESAGLSPASP